MRKLVPVMPLSLLPSFLLYCSTNAITPGPANLCTLSTALRYGRAAALRQWRGLFAGFFIVSMAAMFIARSLGTAMGRYAGALSWVGAAYLLWMAWHTLRSSGGGPGKAAEAPGFLSGLLVNLTNVKVILFCLMTQASYVLPYSSSFRALLPVALFLPVIGPSCNLVWMFAGAALQKVFADNRRAADLVCAAALALCAVNLVLPH
ncbi:LysE family transporter [uncultured Oscillibacter sp.]|uniref:LysE family transporter n=1 Tax=uncultured Oscillibacter sp. TaxID=876091 RepID=UPI0025E29E1B|nr:LysE family transporter [uncultured Oscillibacter sp.]